MNEDAMVRQPGVEFSSLSRRRALSRFGSIALIAAVLSGARREMARAQATPAAGAGEAVARQAIGAINAALASGQTGGIDAVFAPDVAGRPPHRSLVTGEPFSHDLAGLKAGLADIHQFFPDATIAIDDLIASNDTVAARVTFRGTLDTAALETSDEAKAPLEIGGLVYGRVADGRIDEFWACFDPSAYLDLVERQPGTAHAPHDASSGHGHDAVASPGAVAAGAEEVAVTVAEFTISLAPTTLYVDQLYAFVVSNAGAVMHEFVIELPDAVHEPLVVGDRMAMVVGIAPGETRTLGWTFTTPGSYQLACHQPGHYEAGQVLVIDVAA